MSLGAILGWVLAVGLGVAVVRLRRRLELVGDAAHELRGPVTAFSYAVAWLRREPGGVRRALRFEAELERMRSGLADLDAAQEGRRAPARPRTVPLERVLGGVAEGWRAAIPGAGRGVDVRWDAGWARVRADRGRLSQAFGNVLANAAEHGSGPIEIHAVRKGSRAVRVEVRDGGPSVRAGRRGATAADRGRGLRIASRAIEEAGGRLTLERERDGTVAAIELPMRGLPVSARARRKRGVVLLVLALACGALAASEVGDRVSEVEGRIGVPVPVVVAARDLEPGAELTRGDLRLSRVPQRFAPPDAPTSPEQAVGLRTAGPVAAGSPITAGVVGAVGDGDEPGALRSGERAVEVAVAGGAALVEGAAPGSRVDVLVSTDPGDGPGSSFVALEDVELLALAPGGAGDVSLDGDPSAAASSAVATLRATLRQAVYLTAAQTYAREVRLLPRPLGDRRRVGRAAVGADDL